MLLIVSYHSWLKQLAFSHFIVFWFYENALCLGNSLQIDVKLLGNNMSSFGILILVPLVVMYWH